MLAPWKKSYEKLRQCIKKQRHHFAYKGPYSQSYDFSNQFSSVTQSCPTLCNSMNCSNWASLFFIISLSLLRLMSIESVMPSSHLVLCQPLLLLPSILPSIRVFSNESIFSHQMAKVLKLQLQHQSICFRIDWFDLLAVQRTVKSLLQHHSSKALILRCSTFIWSNSHIHT